MESKKSSDTLHGRAHLDKFTGKKIFSVDEIKDLEFDRIIIANQYYKTLEEVWNLGIPEEKIFIANQIVLNEYESKKPDRKANIAVPFVFTPKAEMRKTLDEKLFSIGGSCFFKAEDYVRIGTLQLLAQEITSRKIPGDAAELGVNQGNFAKFINELLPDRTLHLFDTFEGFDQKDEIIERQNSFVNSREIDRLNSEFKQTSVELVLSKMKYPDKVEMHKGYFPSTIPDEEKTFAFVSLDTDLYQPMFEGLKYFYPRLSTGGYIMIHDYNDINCGPGIHQAVENLEKEFGHVTKIPIIDKCGTLIVSK